MAAMMTEGYLKEVHFTDTGISITIDPVSPFAIEYEGTRYILIVPTDFGDKGDGKTCLMLRSDGKTWKVCAKSIVDCPNSLVAIKSSHVKCRFVGDKKFKMIKSLVLV